MLDQKGRVRLVRVVRNEEGRPNHRGRIHVVPFRVYTTEEMVEVLCGLDMWVVRASEWDFDHLEHCTICKRIPKSERLARSML